MSYQLLKCGGTLLPADYTLGCWKPPKCTVTYHYHVHEDIVACTNDCEDLYLLDSSSATVFVQTLSDPVCCIPAIFLEASGNAIFTFTANASANLNDASCALACSPSTLTGFTTANYSFDGCVLTVTVIPATGVTIESGYVYGTATDGVSVTPFQLSSQFCTGSTTLSLDFCAAGATQPITSLTFITCLNACGTAESTVVPTA